MWNGKRKAITFSYDDGVLQDRRLIKLLNKYGLRATFNLNSGLLSQPGRLVRGGISVAHCKWEPSEVMRIYPPHEIAGHTITHPTLTKVEDDAEVIRQVEADRVNLSELAGYDVVGMAYPCGGVNNDDRVAELIKNNTGVKYSRTITTNGSFDLQKNLFRFNPTAYHLDFEKMMSLGERFIEMDVDKPQILYIWGHSFEMDLASENWVRLEEFFKLISGRNDIFYGTNKEVLL